MILTIRTDKPEAEIGLYQSDGTQLDYLVWLAHRKLAETLHLKVTDMLKDKQASLKDLSGIIVFAGPGSFTGLRIGVSVANALAYSLDCPVVATKGDDWIEKGIHELTHNPTEMALPAYDAPALTTPPKS